MARRIPPFARDFPEDPELGALVDAFEAGDYWRVRREAPKLAARAHDESVRAAARELCSRTGTDPLAKGLLLLTLAILVGLSAFWITRGRPRDGAPSNAPAPTVERIPDSFGAPR